MNLLCMSGKTVGSAAAWDLIQTFLSAKFSEAERHLRRLGKVASLEARKSPRNAKVKRSVPDDNSAQLTFGSFFMALILPGSFGVEAMKSPPDEMTKQQADAARGQ